MVGVSGSAAAEAALRFALAEAALHEAPLDIVHVDHAPALTTPQAGVGAGDRTGSADLARTVTHAGVVERGAELPKVEVSTRLEHGGTVRRLLHAADDAATLAVGSCDGRTFPAARLSVLGRLTASAGCPLAVVPEHVGL
ncbi:universal stress protein [Streptomyces sp. NPDC058534]|uniref:universal stress protein n=1 Tax=Streptomyces sp. NPDC058534 TaxID=3346541 RepID=UPI00366071A8